MLSEPQIVVTQTETAAVIRLTIARVAMMSEFGPAVGELMTVLRQQGIAPLGAVFAHHLTMSAENFDFELGVRVTQPVAPTGRVMPGTLPAARVARTVYGGPYEGLPAAWAEFSQWIKTGGHMPAADLWEVYETGPQTSSDSSTWRTELNRPLQG